MKYFLAIQLLVLITANLYGASELTALDVLQKFAENQDKIKSFYFKSVEKKHGEKVDKNNSFNCYKGVITTQTEIKTDGDKIYRCHQYDPVNATITGKISANYFLMDDHFLCELSDYEGSFMGILSLKSTTRKKQILPQKYPFPYNYLHGIIDGVRIDEALPKMQKFSLKPKTTLIAGSHCYQLQAINFDWEYNIWIDPDHGYNVAKFSYVRKLTSGEKLHRITIRNVKFVEANGVWVPSEAYIRNIESETLIPYENYKMHHKRNMIIINPSKAEIGSFLLPESMPANTRLYCYEGGVTKKYIWANGEFSEYHINTTELKVEGVKAWALASTALFIQMRGEKHDTLGGMKLASHNRRKMQKLLKQWWSIESAKDLNKTYNWLILEGGHRKGFEELGKTVSKLSNKDYKNLLAKFKEDKDTYESIQVVRQYYKQVGEKSILAWDYCRAMCICRWAFVAGYITEEQAWSKILPLAKEVQKNFDSWQDVGKNYEIGCKFWWLDKAKEQSIWRTKAFQWLNTDEDSPWVTIAWDLPLE